jgi:predicted MFS family arabinose efflux permease
MMAAEDTEKQKQRMAQYHVSLYSAFKAIGSMIGSFYSTQLMQSYGNRGVFIFAAILPLAVMACSAFALDETIDDGTC